MATQKVTYHDAFLRCWAYIGWTKIGLDRDGECYGPGYFLRLKDFNSALEGGGASTTRRLARCHRCYGCLKALPFEEITEDHVVSRKRGGSNDPENFAPMCAKCNSSKNDHDLMHWLVTNGKSLESLDIDVFVVYCRNMFRLVSQEGNLSSQAHWSLTYLLHRFAESLPTSQHTAIFYSISAADLSQVTLLPTGA